MFLNKRIYAVSPLLLQKIIWIPTRLCLWFFLHLKVKGLELFSTHVESNEAASAKALADKALSDKAVSNRNVIFAVNHSSELDPILIPASLPFWSKWSPVFYASLSKSYYKNKGLRGLIYGGNFFKLWGAHPVYRGLNDYEKSLVNHINIINDGGSVCFFPEGKITRDGQLQPGKGGIVYLAQRTQCPIIPVGITGAFDIAPHIFLSRRRHITVAFGAPIFPHDIPKSNSDEENVAHIMTKIKELMVI